MKKIILPNIIAIGIYNAQNSVKGKVVTPRRKTTMFEIELILEDGGISYIDDESHRVVENLIICAKPGQMRQTRKPFKCYFVHIIVNEGALFDILSSLPNYIVTEKSVEIREIFKMLCEHYNTGLPEDDILVQSLILRLAYLLKSYAPISRIKHSPKSNRHKIIEQIVEYMDKNLTSDLSLEALAGMAKFTPVYFHKLFKASTGNTLHRYVEEKRIKKSINLLLSTDMTLTEISYECGFTSQSYFSYAFKRHMKISPREYAKKLLLDYGKNTNI